MVFWNPDNNSYRLTIYTNVLCWLISYWFIKQKLGINSDGKKRFQQSGHWKILCIMLYILGNTTALIGIKHVTNNSITCMINNHNEIWIRKQSCQQFLLASRQPSGSFRDSPATPSAAVWKRFLNKLHPS
jgi:hypothetical protein